MAQTLPIGLSSWIIQDGNYSDFKVGQDRSFALEFYANDPLKVVNFLQTSAPGHVYQGNAQFEVTGRIVHTGVEWWVADFGIPAYSSYSPEKEYKPGVLVAGEVYLGVDHFAYFESLSRSENSPPLIFDWRIERIEIQTAPFIKRGDRMLVRDPEKNGWRDLQETNAWLDDGGHAEYILHCTRLSDRPRHLLNR